MKDYFYKYLKYKFKYFGLKRSRDDDEPESESSVSSRMQDDEPESESSVSTSSTVEPTPTPKRTRTEPSTPSPPVATLLPSPPRPLFRPRLKGLKATSKSPSAPSSVPEVYTLPAVLVAPPPRWKLRQHPNPKPRITMFENFFSMTDLQTFLREGILSVNSIVNLQNALSFLYTEFVIDKTIFPTDDGSTFVIIDFANIIRNVHFFNCLKTLGHVNPKADPDVPFDEFKERLLNLISCLEKITDENFTFLICVQSNDNSYRLMYKRFHIFNVACKYPVNSRTPCLNVGLKNETDDNVVVILFNLLSYYGYDVSLLSVDNYDWIRTKVYNEIYSTLLNMDNRREILACLDSMPNYYRGISYDENTDRTTLIPNTNPRSSVYLNNTFQLTRYHGKRP